MKDRLLVFASMLLAVLIALGAPSPSVSPARKFPINSNNPANSPHSHNETAQPPAFPADKVPFAAPAPELISPALSAKKPDVPFITADRQDPSFITTSRKDEPWVKRRARIEFDGAWQQNTRLSFNPFPDIGYSLIITDTRTNLNGSMSASGILVDGNERSVGTAQLVMVPGEDFPGYSGSFRAAGALFRLHQEEGGATFVEEIIEKNFPPDDPEDSEALNHEAAHADNDGPGDSESSPPTAAAADGDTHIVRVLVAYTNGARTAQGGVSSMEALIQLAIDETNTAYTQSGINAALQLAHTVEVSYTEVGFSTDLSRLMSTSDGYMDNVHTLRDDYKADLVALVRTSGEYCGIAYLAPTSASLGFSVTSQTCATGYYSFGHELGHNMGAGHGNGNGGGTYTYSNGYRFGAYRTIMAYSPGLRVQYFSNPLVSTTVSVSGYATHTGPIGSATNDNARTLNATIPTIKDHRGPYAFYSISGAVTSALLPLAGVTIDGGSLGSQTTDSNGRYTFADIELGTSYSLTPSLNGYRFNPGSASGTLSSDATHDFALNQAPNLAPIIVQDLRPGRGASASVSASDPDSGDTLNFSAQTLSLPAAAYELDRLYNITSAGSYLQNQLGLEERWMRAGSSDWIYITPTGHTYHRTAGNNSSIKLVAVLDSTYWDNPELIINSGSSSGTASGISVTYLDGLLYLSADSSFVGSVNAKVSVSDGSSSDSELFIITVVNHAPVLAPIADLTVAQSSSAAFAVFAGDEDAFDELVLSAQLVDAGDPLTRPLSLNIEADSITVTARPDVSGPFALNVTVTDPYGASVSQLVTVTVVTRSDDSGSGGSGDGDSGGGGDSSETPEAPQELDSDGDGVIDAQEELDGTDSEDAGSYLTHLGSPIYTTWTGRFDTVNVLHLSNSADSNSEVTVSISGFDGEIDVLHTVSVPAQGSSNINLNRYDQYDSGSQGLVKIEYTSGAIAGKMIYSRKTAQRKVSDFLYEMPFTGNRFGETALAINEESPSGKMINVLSLANASDEEASFYLSYYDESGELVHESAETLAGRGALEIDLGEYSSLPVIASVLITPYDNSLAYLARIVRYAEKTFAADSTQYFSFARGVEARAGNGRPLMLPISRRRNEVNRLVVTNTLDEEITVTLSAESYSSSTSSSSSRTIQAHGSITLDSALFLTRGNNGVLVLISDKPNSVFAESFLYQLYPRSGNVRAALTVSAQEALSRDWLRLWQRTIAATPAREHATLARPQKSLAKN